MVLFPYLYRVASATAYASLPINRTQLFFTQLVSGFVLIIGPLLLLSIILLVPVRYESLPFWFTGNNVTLPFIYLDHSRLYVGDIINTLPRVTGFFLRNALGFVFYFSIITLAANLAGNRVAAVLLGFVLAFAPMLIVSLGDVIASFYIFGYGAFRGTATGIVTGLTHPMGWMSAYGGFPSRFGLRAFALVEPLYPYTISYSLIALTVFCLAFIAHKKRPHERAGDTVAFVAVRRVSIFLLSLAGMIIVGMIWLQATRSRTWLYIGFVIGFIVAYFIAQMIAEKTLRVGHKVKPILIYGAIALSMYAVILLITGLGFWRYERNIPQEGELTGVAVEMQWIMGSNRQREDHFFVEDPETITRVLEIHENILNNRSYLMRARWGSPGLRSWDLSPFNITYRMADGSIITRSYWLTHHYNYDRWDAISILNSGPMILARTPAIKSPEVIESIRFSADRGANHYMNEFLSSQAMADLYNMSVEEFLGDRASYVIDMAFGTWPEIRDSYQVIRLIEAIQADLLAAVAFTLEESFEIFLNIRPMYAHRNWGNLSILLPIDGQAGEWLVENGFIAIETE